jgi:hypothetical protein
LSDLRYSVAWLKLEAQDKELDTAAEVLSTAVLAEAMAELRTEMWDDAIASTAAVLALHTSLSPSPSRGRARQSPSTSGPSPSHPSPSPATKRAVAAEASAFLAAEVAAGLVVRGKGTFDDMEEDDEECDCLDDGCSPLTATPTSDSEGAAPADAEGAAIAASTHQMQ